MLLNVAYVLIVHCRLSTTIGTPDIICTTVLQIIAELMSAATRVSQVRCPTVMHESQTERLVRCSWQRDLPIRLLSVHDITAEKPCLDRSSHRFRRGVY